MIIKNSQSYNIEKVINGKNQTLVLSDNYFSCLTSDTIMRLKYKI